MFLYFHMRSKAFQCTVKIVLNLEEEEKGGFHLCVIEKAFRTYSLHTLFFLSLKTVNEQSEKSLVFLITDSLDKKIYSQSSVRVNRVERFFFRIYFRFRTLFECV